MYQMIIFSSPACKNVVSERPWVIFVMSWSCFLNDAYGGVTQPSGLSAFAGGQQGGRTSGVFSSILFHFYLVKLPWKSHKKLINEVNI